MAIRFYSGDVEFQLPKPRATSSWIKKAIKSENKTLHTLTYIFCSDRFLLDLNKKYLKHNTLTDIITFDLSEDPGSIFGEVYISIDRVADNAEQFKEPFEKELHRVLIHGVLHLAGFNDKTPSEKARMREKEEAYLSLYRI